MIQTLTITDHAVERYIERVEPVSEALARIALSRPCIVNAALFGARYVKLAGKQRVVLKDMVVLTVLPSDHSAGKLGRDRHG